MRALIGAVVCLALSACGNAQRARDWAPGHSDGWETPSATPSENALLPDQDDPELQSILRRVSEVRHLPIKTPVKSRALSRPALLTKLRQKMAEEIPPGVIALQGESLRALELVPLDYDFEAGLLKLLNGRIAGLYDPDDKTMYLLDDLGDSLKEETLNHELVHALQDQSFDLAPLLKWKPGIGDETDAIQTLVEGDATSAMFEVGGGSSLTIDEAALRTMFLMSTRLSSDGLTTPSILQSSLISPYTDGFAFVQSLRRHGGWGEVDEAFHHLPTTTEQVLHIDKFLAHEKAIFVADPTLATLGPGFTPAFVDSLGELGLREMLEEWEARVVAKTAAEGWGGDRYVVAQKKRPDGSEELAVAFHLRMDTVRDAEEVAAVLTSALGIPVRYQGGEPIYCKERATLGPIAWSVRDADVALVAGPYEKIGDHFRSLGDCTKSRAWVGETLGPAAPKPALGPHR